MNVELTQVEFLPSKFFRLNNAGGLVLNDKIDRLRKFSYIHYEAERIVEQLAQVVFNGFLVRQWEETNVHIHCKFEEYGVDFKMKCCGKNMVVVLMDLIQDTMLNEKSCEHFRNIK